MSLKAIATPFTRLLSRSNSFLQIPIVGAPMAGASGAKLATEVTLGGAYGFIPAGYRDAAVLRKELDIARQLLRVPPTATLPLGVAYFGWKLKEQGDAVATELLDASLQNNVQAIWFSFWDKGQSKWARYIREADANRPEPRNTIIFVLVTSVEEALLAVNEWKADVIVAQGMEAGGHGAVQAPPIRELVSSILSALPDAEKRPPILAAGGISNGSQVAEFLRQGASGAVLGTRFLVSPESTYTAGQKSALLAATSDSTVRSVKFDESRNTLGWPEGADGRGLRNALAKEFESRDVNMDTLKKKVAEATKKDEPDYMVTWAGLGVGALKEIKGAQDIVRELHEELLQHHVTAKSSL
ncbi:hypothetical protein EIP91_010820 [Steccherinum ochraceum]|uniref:Uncharacterized protein n=1 Tax=Steccherinum ochraceum TaxID=92696 RepID=A0A4R0RSF2_9APHY|nr:hypothetical protein EIP91_010820 [Steccherinum ochraceum]